jgi:hypothetical protein
MDHLIACANNPDLGFFAMRTGQQLIQLCGHVICLTDALFVVG